MNKKDEFKIAIINFIDENVLGKSSTTEQFIASLEIVTKALELKGPLDLTVSKYLSDLRKSADEFISMKNKGIVFSTANVYPKKTINPPVEEKTKEEVKAKEKKYSDPCCPTVHYSSGC